MSLKKLLCLNSLASLQVDVGPHQSPMHIFNLISTLREINSDILGLPATHWTRPLHTSTQRTDNFRLHDSRGNVLNNTEVSCELKFTATMTHDEKRINWIQEGLIGLGGRSYKFNNTTILVDRAATPCYSTRAGTS